MIHSMQTWHVDALPATGSLSLCAVSLLLEATSAPEPAAKLLEFLEHVAPVDYLTHVEYVEQRGKGLAAPELLEGHSAPDIPNISRQCFAIYRERFWRRDECTQVAQHMRSPDSPISVLRFKPGEADAPCWRSDVYRRMQLEDRLSFIYSPVPGVAYGINLYRGRRHGPFGAAEIERLLRVAPLLKQTHRAILAPAMRQQRDLAERIQRAGLALRRQVPELSEREREVCARIACGATAEDIAADLQVAQSTVTTLRKRAYAKLTRRGLPAGRSELAQLAQ